MAYYGSWEIDDLLTFVVNTHRVDTGAGSDADAVPYYRVYEDETATPLITGSMALLDGSNTVGLYSEQITLSAANGFEAGKSYNIYITATVNGVAATMSHNFQMEAKVQLGVQGKADVNAEVVDTLNTDTYAEPGQEAPPATTTLVKKLGYLYKFLRNRKTQTATLLSLYADDATTIDQKSTVSDNGTTLDSGEIGSGP